MLNNPFARPDGGGGSFLPQDYVARKAELRANLLCLGLFGVVMFGVIGAFFVTNRQWLRVREDQQTITTQYSQETTKIEQLTRLETQKSEMMEKAEITTALIEKVPRSTLLSELITRMPQEITVLELSLVSKRVKEPAASAKAGGAITTVSSAPAIKTLSGSGAKVAGSRPPAMAKDAKGKSQEPEKVPPPKFDYTLHIVGVARQNNNIADYLAGLKGCSLLENVDLKYIKETTIEKLELRKFEIECAIRKDADGRGIEAAKDLRATGVPGANPARPDLGKPDPQPQTNAAGKEQ
jgi:Tfp pilus assembly protein PilN